MTLWAERQPDPKHNFETRLDNLNINIVKQLHIDLDTLTETTKKPTTTWAVIMYEIQKTNII
jgi:hypothetical protein